MPDGSTGDDAVVTARRPIRGRVRHRAERPPPASAAWRRRTSPAVATRTRSAADAEDRRYLRILLIMVVVIVLAGFVLGIVAALAGLDALVGEPG